jgi:hypothetical protein
MRLRSEEEPEPDEDPGEAPAATAVPTPVVPAVASEGREHEYRTELLTAAEVLDGSTLAERLTAASAEGWDLVDVIPAGDQHAVLLRRQKSPQRGPRPVGFAPPSG